MLRSIFGFLKDDAIEEMKSNAGSTVVSSDWNGITGQEYVHKLSEKNHTNFLKSHKSILVMFYAPWCGHCKTLKPEFALAASSLARSWSGVDATLASCNCDDNPKMVQRYQISGYPTLIYFQDGKRVREYNQGRRAADMIAFMSSK